jgi:hypothetical protein
LAKWPKKEGGERQELTRSLSPSPITASRPRLHARFLVVQGSGFRFQENLDNDSEQPLEARSKSILKPGFMYKWDGV